MVAEQEQDSRGDMRRRLGSDTAVEMQREGSATSTSSWVMAGDAPYQLGFAAAAAAVPIPPEFTGPLHVKKAGAINAKL